MKRLLVFLTFVSLSVLRAEHPVWRPEKTWVFAVGVLKFDNSTLATWPDEGREDAVMIAAMQKRGVPTDHILFLKNEQATKANIAQKFAPFLHRAAADDTLIFYYAGHGGRNYSDPARTCTFVTYDAASTWTVASVFDTVEKNFHGEQVIYAVDCCHSGSIVEQAALHKGREAELASAHVSSTSTGNWTFTRCLVDMLEGNPLLDLNGDGEITFGEAARFIVDEMAFTEGQHSSSGVRGGFSPDTVMAFAKGKHTPHMGQLIEGESQGKWWKAEVIGEKDGKYLVTWPGWGKKYDEWLPLNRTRPYQPKTFPVGAQVQTEWRGQWYPARVLKVELGLHLVHYDGFESTDDEWVALSRLKTK
jgi:Caspase domain